MKRFFSVAGIVFYPYSLFMIAGVGALLGLFTAITLKRHPGKSDENTFVIEMLIICTAAALPAAVLFDALFHFIETGKFTFGGATFYGGLLGALALFPPLLAIRRERTVTIYDRLCDLAPCIAAGHCLGRIGCFFGGCCFGKPTDSFLGVVFPEGSMPYEFYGGAVAVHPTQLYEAAFLALLALFLWKPAKRDAFPLYLILYGIWRFFLEFLRGDDRGAFPLLPLTPAQGISVLLVLLGATLLTVRLIRMRASRREK